MSAPATCPFCNALLPASAPATAGRIKCPRCGEVVGSFSGTSGTIAPAIPDPVNSVDRTGNHRRRVVAVFVLVVPPLRQCTEDLPDAWRVVLRQATRTAGVAADGCERFGAHPALLDAFSDHPLPGNFRDLQRAAYHLLAALKAERTEQKIIDGAIASLGPRESRRHVAPNAADFAELLPATWS